MQIYLNKITQRAGKNRDWITVNAISGHSCEDRIVTRVIL